MLVNIETLASYLRAKDRLIAIVEVGEAFVE